MQINFRAIVSAVKLPKGSALLPLFEAVVNSIQSIQEAGTQNGLVEIKITRDVAPIGSESWEAGIHSFVISDNGIGFNDRHFESFNVYGTDYKRLMGCKGVGRVLWLKAFSSVNIESSYRAPNGQLWDRKFGFSISGEMTGTENCPAVSNTETGAKVSLVGFSNEYKQHCPKRLDTLAREVMNHCFAFLALEVCPKIVIIDGEESRCVNDVFTESINDKNDLSVINFNANGNNFNLICAKSHSPSMDRHMLHFCANKREVFGENLSKFMPELTGKLADSKGEFTYNGYVTGALLDDNINGDRTDFSFSRIISESDEDQLELDGFKCRPVSKAEIIASAIPVAREFLKNEISACVEKNKARIEEYVFSKNPRYRTVLSHCSECASRIPYTNDDSKLELELFKSEQALKLKTKIEQSELLGKELGSISVSDLKTYEDAREALMKKLSDLGKGALADYVVHRKAMLETFSKCLEYHDEDKRMYALEKSVHSLIFPLTTTSDNIEYNQHNLWIIDEKLAYHYYLASDKPISKNSSKEPDIAIFEPAFAFAGDIDRSSLNNITIIEFKRPGRTDKECVEQVLTYMSLIREGKCKDRHGRPVTEADMSNMRFSCYILCDLNADMKTFLEFRRNFHRTPDGTSYYMYFDNFNAYIEIMPYSKLINDARMRNKILFDQLFCQ